MKFKYTVILYIFMLLNIKLYSQLTLAARISTAGYSYVTLDDIWDLTLYNNIGLTYNNTFINFKLNNDTALIYEANAGSITINQSSTQTITKSSFKSIKVEYASKTFKQCYDSLQIIPSGHYILCYTVYSQTDSIAISTLCKSLSINNIIDKKPKNKNIISSTGNIQFTSFFAFGDTLPKNPGNYFNWRGNPTVELYNIPIRADFQFNIINSEIDPVTSYFNYVFDGDRLRENLKNEALKRAKEVTKNLNQYKLVYEKAQKELINVNTILNNPGIQKDMLMLKVRDSIQNILYNKLKPLHDSISNKADKFINTQDSLKQYITDSILNRPKAGADNFQDKLQPDTLLAMVIKDSTLLKKAGTDADSIKQLIVAYKKFDYLALEQATYNELLKKRERLKWLMNKADSLKNLSPQNLNKPDISPVLNGAYNVLGQIQTLSFGTHVNTTSDFTCFGLPLLGLNFQTQNKGLILQYTNAKQTDNLVLNTNKYFYRHYDIYGAGYGNKDVWSIKLIYMSASDKAGKKQLPADSIEFYGPSVNRILSTIAKAKIFKQINFEAEIAGSETVKNKLYYSIAGNDVKPTSIYNPRTGESLQNIITRNNVDANRYVGYAAKVSISGTIPVIKTKIVAGFKRTGKDFNTYGNPMLFKNALTADLKLNQLIYRNNIKLGVIFKYNNFYKDSTSLTLKTLYQYGVDFMLNFPKYPTLRLLYIPTQQIINSQALILNTLNVLSTFSYQVKKYKNLITVNAMSQNTSKYAVDNYYFKSINAGIVNITQINNRLSATLRYSYNLIGFENYLTILHSTELSGTYNLLKHNWIFNAALLYNEANNNRKIGGTIEVQHPLNEIFSFSLKVQKNSYTNYINNPLYPQQYNFPSYNEWLLYGSINLKW